MQPEFHSGAVTRPLSAMVRLAMMGCPALRARGELAAGACAPVLGWDRGGSSSALFQFRVLREGLEARALVQIWSASTHRLLTYRASISISVARPDRGTERFGVKTNSWRVRGRFLVVLQV